MAQDYKILFIEDEKDLAEPLRTGLIEEGFIVELASDGQTAMRKIGDHWDLIILDLMLPDLPGEAILSCLKQKPDYPPVLVLTARPGLETKLSLFRQGCDDFMAKPVIFEELVERIRALLRRSHRVEQDSITYFDLSLDPQTSKLLCKDSSVQLTPKETTLLRFFFQNRGRIVSRKELLHNIWGLKEEPETNFIGVHLFNLRKKLSEISREDWLQTIRSSGFLFSKPETT